MADGFLGRWAKRKEAVRRGEEVAPEPEKPQPVAPPPIRHAAALPVAPPPAVGEGRGGGTPAAEPPPTLEDIQSLSKDSDFTRFVRPDVTPEVKNAAMKKLFSDPHFNVMDRLDTYIDDYSQPDPIPPAMLRSLASARFLNLFDEEKDEEGKKAGIREGADDGAAQTVAQSSEAAAESPDVVPPAEDHADPDLRLQQDHAPGPRGPGQGTE